MKKFTFQFESILTAKQQQLQLAEAELAHRLRLLREAEAHVEECEARIQQACVDFAKSMQSPMMVGRYQQAEEMMGNLRATRDAAKTHSELRRAEWSASVAKCKRLGAEVEGLCTLRLEAKDEYRKELGRHAQMQLDEFVIRSWST